MSIALKLEEHSREQENRMELERVLTSLYFRRAPALCKFLSYVCESYFRGLAHEVKEYNIAVSALGRRSWFDPQRGPLLRWRGRPRAGPRGGAESQTEGRRR